MLSLTAGDCVRALRLRFAPPEWAFLEQVANGTGYASQVDERRRWADALAVGIWPSRGCMIHGFEIKVSRSDWKSELAKPDKAEAVQKYCDHWWIVAPKGMIPKAELPPTWGLVEVNEARKPHTLVAAPKLKPVPLERHFIAAMIRKHSQAFEGILTRDTAAARAEGAARGDPTLADRLEIIQKQHAQLVSKVEEFEKASGVSIQYQWRVGDVGKAVELLLDGQRRASRVTQLEEDLKAYTQRCDSLRADIKAIRAVPSPVKAVG